VNDDSDIKYLQKDGKDDQIFANIYKKDTKMNFSAI
jgi:hypothetical protein